MICKNCEKSFDGNYCSHCGQKSEIKRIDVRYLINEIPNSIFQLDRGFLFTMKELFVRPGHSIREFLVGKRKPHYKPFAYLVITFTLYALISYLSERSTFIDDLLYGFKGRMSESGEAVDAPILDWISKHQVYVTLFILPFFSLASYLAFVRSGYNYFEHLILNLYINGQQMIIYMLLGFIFYQDNLLTGIPIFIGFLYNFWAYFQFFESKRTSTKIGLMALTYLLFVLGIFLGAYLVGYLLSILAT